MIVTVTKKRVFCPDMFSRILQTTKPETYLIYEHKSGTSIDFFVLELLFFILSYKLFKPARFILHLGCMIHRNDYCDTYKIFLFEMFLVRVRSRFDGSTRKYHEVVYRFCFCVPFSIVKWSWLFIKWDIAH